eukprot:2903282-Ditylum_brightwellii.AAC.1
MQKVKPTSDYVLLSLTIHFPRPACFIWPGQGYPGGGDLFHNPQATELVHSVGTSPAYTPDHQYPLTGVPARFCKAYPWATWPLPSR